MTEGDSVIYRVDLRAGRFEPLAPANAADLMVREKRIEEWVATRLSWCSPIGTP